MAQITEARAGIDRGFLHRDQFRCDLRREVREESPFVHDAAGDDSKFFEVVSAVSIHRVPPVPDPWDEGAAFFVFDKRTAKKISKNALELNPKKTHCRPKAWAIRPEKLEATE